jgi:hypothetical protein
MAVVSRGSSLSIFLQQGIVSYQSFLVLLWLGNENGIALSFSQVRFEVACLLLCFERRYVRLTRSARTTQLISCRKRRTYHLKCGLLVTRQNPISSNARTANSILDRHNFKRELSPTDHDLVHISYHYQAVLACPALSLWSGLTRKYKHSHVPVKNHPCSKSAMQSISG